MNRTLKDVTVKPSDSANHDQLRQPLADFVTACNVGRRLTTLKGVTPYAFICKQWTSKPERFSLNLVHQMPGLKSWREPEGGGRDHPHAGRERISFRGAQRVPFGRRVGEVRDDERPADKRCGCRHRIKSATTAGWPDASSRPMSKFSFRSGGSLGSSACAFSGSQPRLQREFVLAIAALAGSGRPNGARVFSHTASNRLDGMPCPSTWTKPFADLRPRTVRASPTRAPHRHL